MRIRANDTKHLSGGGHREGSLSRLAAPARLRGRSGALLSSPPGGSPRSSVPGHRSGATHMATSHHDSEHDCGAHAATAATDAHDDHAFDDTPLRDLPPDEPRTPGWLSLLGVAVFVMGAVAVLATGEADGGEGRAPTDGARPKAAVDRPSEERAVEARPPTARPSPAGSQAEAVRRLSPEQAREIQKRLDQIRRKRAQPGSAQPGSAQPGSAQPGSAQPGSAVQPAGGHPAGTDEPH